MSLFGLATRKGAMKGKQTMNSNHPSNLIAVDNDSFDALVTNAAGVVLVDFWAAWCGPCRLLGPLLPKLALDYTGKLTIAKFDTEANKGEDSVRNRFDFQGIPALLIFRDGQVVAQLSGYAPYEDTKARFAEVLSPLNITANPAAPAAEAAFAAAAAAATERYESALAPVEEKMEAAIAPVRQKYGPDFEAARTKLESGAITQDEFDAVLAQYRAAANAAYTPFMEEYKAANGTALVQYESDLAAATAQFAQTAPATTSGTTPADLHDCDGGVCKL